MGNGAAATAANGSVPSATLDVVSAALATVLATVGRRADSTWPPSTSATATTIAAATPAPPPTPQPNDVDPGLFIYGFCLVLIPTATILGNLLVIISVLRFKALHSAINFLILGLAVADLLVALFVMPYAVYVYVQGGAWYLGPLMCDIYSASDVACSTASILLLAVISFDRYRAVSRPIQYSRQSQNIRRVVIILIIIWLISLAIASPIVLGVNYRPPDAEPNECRFYNPEFSIGSSIVSFVIPCFIVLFVYIRIMMALRKRERAAKMRRVANQQETNKVGDMSTDENDAGQIVTAPAINMLMLALPTIQRRMRRFDRHQRAVQEAGDLFRTPSLFLSSPTISPNVKCRVAESSPTFSSPFQSPRPVSSCPSSRPPALPPTIGATHGLASALSSAVCASAVSAGAADLTTETPTQRRCRFSSIDRVKEYIVESDEEREESENEEDEDDEETDEDFDDFSSEDRFDSSERKRRLFTRMGTGMASRLTDAAVSVIGARPRLSLAEPNANFFNLRKRFAAQQSETFSAAGGGGANFMRNAAPQTLGFSSLMPLLAANPDAIRRCSDTVSQFRMDSRPLISAPQSPPTAEEPDRRRAFSASPTRPPDPSPHTPRPSPRDNSLDIPSSNGTVVDERRLSRSLTVDDPSSPTITLNTLPATITTPLASPTPPPPVDAEAAPSSPPPPVDAEAEQSPPRSHREAIWEARASFFRDADLNHHNTQPPVLDSHSPLMLRRFVLEPGNHRTKDERDIANSSSPLSSSDSLSENLHIVTNDFASEAPTSMSRKSSEFDSSQMNHTSSLNSIKPASPTAAEQNHKPQKSPKSDSMIRNSVRRFKSFHMSPRMGLPNMDVSKATAEIFRHLSRRSPRLFRPSIVSTMQSAPPPSNFALRKQMSCCEEAAPILHRYGIVRRQSESAATAIIPRVRSPKFSDAGNRRRRPTPIREIDIPLHQNPLDEIVRHPGALTSSALGEDLDYVDVDSMLDSQDGRNLRLTSGDSFIRQTQRSPVPYSEETTSSATDFVQSAPMHSSSLDANSEINEEMKMSTVTEDSARGLIIENTTALDTKITTIPEGADEQTPKECRKASRPNGKPYNHEPNSPSVTFKIPANETKKMRRLSSAMDVLETTKLLNRSETNSSDPQNHRPSMRTMSQKLTTSTAMTEPSVESAYSSSQSQNTTSIANAASNSGKNLESKLRMVKRAINRKESSLKRKVNKAQRKEKRATKTLGVVVGIFLICWVPFFLINILNAVCIKLKEPRCEVGFEPFFYATWIGYMNSFMNPVIYTIFNTEFRRAFKSLILGRAKGRRHRARPV